MKDLRPRARRCAKAGTAQFHARLRVVPALATVLAAGAALSLGSADTTVADRPLADDERVQKLNADPEVKRRAAQVAEAPAPKAAQHPPFPEIPEVKRQLEDKRREGDQRKARRQSAEARAERRRSRTSHKGRNRAQASQLARDRFPDLFSPADRRALPLGADQQLVRFTGPNSALVKSRGEGASVVESTTPLQARDERGDPKPVDLELQRTERGWEPANPARPLALGERADRALTLPGAFSLGLPGSQSSGARTANEIFFADVAEDTDAWFGPTATGARAGFQLRSADSPEELRLQLDPEPGVSLRQSGDTVELVRDGKVVGGMSAPSAFDADDEPIPTRLRVEGSQVVVEVDHRDRDALYPVAVDPAYEGQDSWRYGATNRAGWSYYQNRPVFSYCFVSTSQCPWGPDGSGFYISRVQGAAPLYSSDFGEYQYSAPNANSFVTRADFLYVRHNGFWTNTTQGMWSRNRGRFIHNLTDWRNLNYEQRIVCVEANVSGTPCDDNVADVYGANNNYVQSSISPNASAPDGRYSSQPAHMYFGGARVWLSDANNPVATYFESLPSGWVDEVPARGYSGANQQVVRFDDAGLGMKSLSLDVPGKARQTTTDGCSGGHSWRCPAYRVGVFSLEGIDEGVQTVRATGGDATQRAGAAQGTVKVDRSAPEVTLSGGLWERRDQELAPGSHELTAGATDGDATGADSSKRSGVKSIEVLVDDERKFFSEQGCAANSCSMTRNWSFDTAQYGGGEHVVEVRSEDQLGHEKRETFNVSTACCSQGSLPWATAIGQEVRYGDVDGDGRDDMVLRNRTTHELKVGLSNGAEFGQPAPWGSWSLAAPADRVDVADVTGDGLADVIGRRDNGSDVLVAPSTGSGFALPQTRAQWPAAREFRVADMDGNRIADIAGRDTATGDFWVSLVNDAEEDVTPFFDAAEQWGSVAPGLELHLADANGDDAADVVTRDPQSNAISVADSDMVALEPTVASGSVPNGADLLVADMNGDHSADLISRDRSTGEVRLAESTGESFKPSRQATSFASQYLLSAVDGDGNGEDDLAGQHELTGEIRLALSRVAVPVQANPEEWDPDPTLFYSDEDITVADPNEPEEPPEQVPSSPNPAKAAAGPPGGMRLAWQDDGRFIDRTNVSDADVTSIYNRITEAGGQILRLNVYWPQAENRNGFRDAQGNLKPYEFGRIDRAVTEAKNKGLRVYLTLTSAKFAEGCNSNFNANSRACANPREAPTYKPGADTDSSRQSFAEAYGRFVRATVEHFDGRGVDTFALWNEPNAPTFLRDFRGHVSPARLYGQLYNEGYTQARTAFRGSRILIGELSAFPIRRQFCTSRNQCPMQRVTPYNFLDEALAARRLKAHGVAWHPYAHDRLVNSRPRRARTRSGKPGEPTHGGIPETKSIQNTVDKLTCKDTEGQATRGCKYRLRTPKGGRPGLLFTEFGYFNRRREENARRNTYHNEGFRSDLWRAALRKAQRNKVHWMLAYTATEDTPDEQAADGQRREDYGIFSRTGAVTGERGYGKDYPREPQTRRVYCVIWHFYKDPDADNVDELPCESQAP